MEQYIQPPAGGIADHDSMDLDDQELAFVQLPEDEDQDLLLTATRAYQMEMYEASLRRNIIVAMDTGTGKTRIAILRIRAELERSPPPKIVWFLAPTVFLCLQQFDAITSQIPGVQAKILTGDSGVDAWSTIDIWNAALLNVRIVVATPQVLLDALIHGFVNITNISLLIFDEAHGCVKESAGRRIMAEFYYRYKNAGFPSPAILGLTASPVQGNKLDGIDELERTLDAACVAPTRHRDDLIAHTKRPLTLRHICSPDEPHLILGGPNLTQLRRVSQSGYHYQLQYNRARQAWGAPGTGGTATWTWKFMKSFCRRAEKIQQQLGPWASEYYIHKVIRRCVKAAQKRAHEDRQPFLMALLQQVEAVRPVWPDDSSASFEAFKNGLSSRVQVLFSILLHYDNAQPTGIVFVSERPMAAVLARLISLHPLVRARFRAGHIVGMSQTQADGFEGILYLGPKDGRRPLQRFRARTVNLLVATSVVEEGIDIPACNLVICIDQLTSLKAFIQRRGRARDENSEFHLLVEDGATQKSSREWEGLEEAMKRKYEDEMREVQHWLDVEKKSDLNDELLPPLYVPETGARLPARDARQHLQHFCATSTSTLFVDWRPLYQSREDQIAGYLRASVRLPITLPAMLRTAHSAYAWRTESDAWCDAAFQAYKAINEAGLLSNNLLPPQKSADMLLRSVETRPGVVPVREQHRPWPQIAQQWKAIQDGAASHARTTSPSVYRHTIRIENDNGSELFEADLVLPCALPPGIQPFDLFWTAHSARPWIVHISEAECVAYGTGEGEYHDSHDHSGVLLSAAYGHRWPIGEQHRLARVVFRDEHLRADQIAAAPFDPKIFDGIESFSSPDIARLVRDADGVPYVYQEALESKPPLSLVRKSYGGFEEAPEDVPFVVLQPWPKIVGMLHKTENVQLFDDPMRPDADLSDSAEKPAASAKPYPRVLPAANCRVDNLPMAYVQFGSLLPSLTPVLEVYLVAAELMASTRLSEIPIHDLSLVATAISAPGARLPTNYENLEFIGDSVLKVLASANLAAQNLQSPEGHLSLFKDRLVSNARLCRSALDLGLDRFIVSKQWSLKPWVKYCDGLNVAAEETDDADTRKGKRRLLELSSKVLADVVESLIGACCEDGGMPVALQCVGLFVPDIEWLSLEASRERLYAEALEEPPWQPPPALESLIGYTFTKKSLLVEAMTHASVPSEQKGSCMERLEFIGDAILDHVVVQQLASAQPTLSYYKMHVLRTTLVNAGFLGFICMSLSISETATAVSPDGQSVRTTEFKQPLWSFMKHGVSRDMGVAINTARARFTALRDDIMEALWTSYTYPWGLLTRLRAEKFYSDIVEALIGAVWIDSGSLEAVEALLENMGLLPYMRRVLEDDISILHPKEEIGRLAGNAKIRYGVTRPDAGGSDDAETANSAAGNNPLAVVDSDVDSDGEEIGVLDGGLGTGTGDDDGDALASSAVYHCRLFIDDNCVAEITDGVSTEDAETRTAELAVQLVKCGLLEL